MRIHPTSGLNGLSQTHRPDGLPLPKLNGGSFDYQQQPVLIRSWVSGGALEKKNPNQSWDDFLEFIKPSLEFKRKWNIIKRYLLN